MDMKKAAFLAATLAMAGAIPLMASVTAVWTGAEDSYWTNAANWTVNGAVATRCPGTVSNVVDGVFTAELPTPDVAVFDGTCTSGRTTINLEGLYSISYVTVTGATAPKYTFGTDPAMQSLPFETNGAFTVDASVPAANCPLVNAKMIVPANVDSADFWGLTPDGKTPAGRAAGDYITVNNNGTGTLVFGGDLTGPWFRPGALNTTYMEGRIIFNSRNGGMRFNGDQRLSTYLYAYAIRGKRFEYYGDWGRHRTMVLTYGPEIYIANDATCGVYVVNNSGFTMNSDDTVKILGEGTLKFTENIGGSSSSFANHGPSDIGRGRFEVCSKFVVEKGAGQSGNPRILLRTTQTRGGRLVFRAPEPCDMKGGIYMAGRSIVEIPSTNQFARCPQITVDARMTEVKPNTSTKYATNVVVWAGTEAETFVTPVAFWGDAPRRLTLRNEGTAALTAGMPVSLDGADGNFSLKLDGATSPVIYGAALGTAMPVAVAGDVVLPDGADLTNISGFMLEGGNLRFENASALTPPAISVVSGTNVITVAGTDVTLSLSRTAGVLNIVRTGDAAVVCAALAGQTPAWLTVNGYPATFDGEGRLFSVSPAHDVSIAARGDVVPDGSTQVVGITTAGTGGNDTLAADATAVKGLVQKTAAADATVAIGAAQTLTAEMFAVSDGAGALTVGDVAGQGTLAAAAGGMSLDNQSSSKPLTVNAKVDGTFGVTGTRTVFAGGTESPISLKVHNGTLKLTGSETFELAELMVATNLADATSTLLLENAADVTYSVGADRFTAAVGGGKTVSGADATARLVISNSTLRCDKPGYKENYENQKYTNNTFLVGYNGSAIMEVLEGSTFKGRLAVGGPGDDDKCLSSGAVYQRGGRVELYGISWNKYQGSSFLGGYNVSAGYYELTGGVLLTRGCFVLGMIGTAGVFHQYGGLFCASNCLAEAGGATGSANVVLGSSNSGSGHVFVRNATCDINGNLILNQSYSGSANGQLSVSGADAFVDNHGNTVLANANAANSSVVSANVNLMDGGRMRTGAFRNDSNYSATFTDPSNHFFHVWFDGGTFETGRQDMDVASSKPNDMTPDLHRYGISSFLVGPGGATVDTAGKTGNYSRKPFAAPTNGMVTAISGFTPFATPSIERKKLVGAPAIRIDGDGYGACAIAQFDSRSQMVTNVVITSGGTGYTWAQAVFYYWNGWGGTYQTLDCVVSAPVSGSFTKEGEGDFTFKAANTYGGDTVLKGGVLRLDAAGALPEGTVVEYRGGSLESTAAAFPAELKVRLPGAEDGTARSCTLATFTDELPATLPPVEVVNAPEAGKGLWNASFRDMTLRVVRTRGTAIYFR